MQSADAMSHAHVHGTEAVLAEALLCSNFRVLVGAQVISCPALASQESQCAVACSDLRGRSPCGHDYTVRWPARLLHQRLDDRRGGDVALASVFAPTIALDDDRRFGLGKLNDLPDWLAVLPGQSGQRVQWTQVGFQIVARPSWDLPRRGIGQTGILRGAVRKRWYGRFLRRWASGKTLSLAFKDEHEARDAGSGERCAIAATMGGVQRSCHRWSFFWISSNMSAYLQLSKQQPQS